MSDIKKPRLHLVMLSYTFPFGTGEQFLETEILYSARYFADVTVVPSNMEGTKRPFPDNVIVDTSLAQTRQTGLKRLALMLLNVLSSISFYQELLANPWLLTNWKGLRKVIIYQDNATRVTDWVKSYLLRSDVDLENTLFYTVWLVPQTIGMYFVKQQYPQLKLVSRAHRDDLYETDSVPPYIPFRKQTLLALNDLYVISEHGKRYVNEYYGHYKVNCEVSRVGVKDPGFTNQPSTDGVFRIVSCSFMIPVKRLELLIAGLELFSNQNPNLPIEWHHIGDGYLRPSIEKLAAERLPANIKCFFHGHLSNPDVFNFYRTYSVDVFVNVSESEGIPAAIMEAQSCGIPIVATAVGGTPEIVNDVNGILLNNTPTPAQVATALTDLAIDLDRAAVKRNESKHTWQTVYNAEKNYLDFVNRLIKHFE
jgi:colanic acid/amylovoran biosynthesis glycosyltransferase